MMSVTLV